MCEFFDYVSRQTGNWKERDLAAFAEFWQRLEKLGAQKCDEIVNGDNVTLVISDDYKRALSDFNAKNIDARR